MKVAGYKHSSDFFVSSSDGDRIFYQSWIPEGDTKATLVIQHGFGEHSGRYGHLISRLKGEGFAIFALDSRGHGRSPGPRGHVNDFQFYANDLSDLLKLAKESTRTDRFFLLGHSLGAVISAHAVLGRSKTFPLTGLLLSSGAFTPVLDLEKQIKKSVGQFIANFLPALAVDANLDVTYISRDPQEVDAYRNDPLVHGKISMKMGVSLFESGKEAIKRAREIFIPIFMFHGDADKIADCRGTQRFYENLSSKDKALKIYEGYYHETMNEPAGYREKVLDDITEWMKKRLS